MSDEPRTTTELRWFFDGELPPEVADWFLSDALSPHRPLLCGMEDRYLWTGREDASSKVRGGELERKRRSDRWPITLGAATGWVERWHKESGGERDDEVRPLMAIVRKRRRWLHFAGGPAGIDGIADAGRDAPLVVELTSLVVPAHRGWTLCIETHEGHELLEPMVARVTASFPSRAVTLGEEESMGYPAWLLAHSPQPRRTRRDGARMPRELTT